ncbi:PIR protein, putative [Plasmodium sp. DRC-Itaito]|nr:PIR protein, putative [Plasmodium sp. DRC-Itaito]
MKLFCSKILLFFLQLNILVTLHHVNTHKKLHSIPRHTPIYTSRQLSEKDIQSSIHDNDEDIKSVKENFHRQTTQRFKEYEERMREKRQKRKEQRDENIQKIIEKDKMERSLTEKVEKGCLMCGCALGGVAASVGIFGTVAVKELAKSALVAAEKLGATEISAAKAMGDAAGAAKVIAGLEEMGVSTLNSLPLKTFINPENYTKFIHIYGYIKTEYITSSCISFSSGSVPDTKTRFCTWVTEQSVGALKVKPGYVSETTLVETHVKKILAEATTHAADVTKTATHDAIKISTEAAKSAYASSQTAIIASVVAIIIIALVMIIIYLVLRYRRKKKMKKKAEYTKLLNQ